MQQKPANQNESLIVPSFVKSELTMSFDRWQARPIAEGDVVVAYSSPQNQVPITIARDGLYNCKFGTFRHNDMIGKAFGHKMASLKGDGFIHLLHPTPELWTQVLPHRTQILYLADIAFVTLQLDIGPGSVVIESGTGSGSFSHSLARAVAPNGHLFTFEYHQLRAQQAQQEFELHKISDYVTVTHRDVCALGFGRDGSADAVFLDLPSPWLAVGHAAAALKKSKPTRICSFSPCVEQVQKTCEAMRNHGFVDIRTFETLLRFYELRPGPDGDLDDLLRGRSRGPPLPSAGEADDDGASSSSTSAAAAATTGRPRKRARIDDKQLLKSAGEMRGHTSFLTFATMLPPVNA